MRNCPSLSVIILRKVSRHKFGASSGNMPSSTNMSAIAARKLSPFTTYLPEFGDFMYLKKALFGSSTITSLLLLKLWRYASMLR